MGILDSVSELMNGSAPKTTNNMLEGLSDLRKYDVGRSSYFKVEVFNVPFTGVAPSSGNDPKSLSYLCHSAELPGESTATVSQKIYGVNEKFSVMTGYNDIQLAFYTRGSGDEMVRKFFQSWIAFITGRDETVKQINLETTYNVKYKSEYAASIKITHYAISGDPLLEVTLFDAFPLSINQIPLSWSLQNQAQSLNVVFAYTEYQYDFKYVIGMKPYAKGPLGQLLETTKNLTGAAETIQGSIKSGNYSMLGSVAPSMGLSNFSVSRG
jgi:hypothetical protein